MNEVDFTNTLMYSDCLKMLNCQFVFGLCPNVVVKSTSLKRPFPGYYSNNVLDSLNMTFRDKTSS